AALPRPGSPGHLAGGVEGDEGRGEPGRAGAGVSARRIGASATARTGQAAGEGGTAWGRGPDLPAFSAPTCDRERLRRTSGGPRRAGAVLRTAGRHGSGARRSALAVRGSDLGSPIRGTRLRRGGRGRPAPARAGVGNRRAGPGCLSPGPRDAAPPFPA